MKKSKHSGFNDQLSKALNKRFGFPEDYDGPIEGFENTVPVACEVFNSKNIEYKSRVQPLHEASEGGV